MMFERRQIGAGNAPSGPAWLVAGAPRPQMQHDGAAELSFAPPCHNAQPHGRAPGSPGPMAEVVDTQQVQDLDQELVRRDRKRTRLNSSQYCATRISSSACTNSHTSSARTTKNLATHSYKSNIC